MKIIKMVAAILGVAILPFCIQWIVLEENIVPFNFKIAFSKDIWFGFLGSYIGAIGTVVLGMVSLSQNRKLSDANKRLSKLQEDFFGNLTKPILKLDTSLSFVYETNDKDIQKVVTAGFDSKWPIVCDNISTCYKETQCMCVTMKLYLENLSSIPLVDFHINKFSWKIDATTYNFNCNLATGFSKTICEENLNLLNIYIVYPDNDYGFIIQSFYEGSRNSGRFSQITTEITVRNQAGRSRAFSIDIQFVKKESMDMYITNYLIQDISEISVDK